MNATATTIDLSVEATPGYVHADHLTPDSAALTSDLLNINHAAYHTRWEATFHNHIVHHQLALWALGATPGEIQAMWDFNTPYQSSIQRNGATLLPDFDLTDPVVFTASLGKDECYDHFLKFFEAEVAAKGMQTVVREYVLQGDARADDILGRMFSDLVHPMIHLGCGIEFHQPAIVAEALAGACVHDNWPIKFLIPTEQYVRTEPNLPRRSLLEILDALRQDPEIASGVKASDPFNKIPDGFLQRITADQLAPVLGQFQVAPTDEGLQRGMADLMYTAAFMVGAAQRPGKRESIDFVLLHCCTLAVFFPAILAQDWLSNEHKARLLTATARVNAVMYAGCGSPALDASRVLTYQPRQPSTGWRELFQRAVIYRDEGHAAKLVRALYSLEALPEPAPGFPLNKGDFLTIAHMVMDSIEMAFEADGPQVPQSVSEGIRDRLGPGAGMVVDNMRRWVFYGGLEGAWDRRPDLRTVSR
ncbi:hypothetical protein BO94DRAFT_476313 [Aspergillus sclerotioniger CBS 115572]|uniref:Oxidoreductase AflY n=1 Tax=Aspergillus sclerotioniger CBS 115572 TaxID=1450535 RepID=A0A317VEA4_9EURO|nr:hypothetical protein BO94DRAFT_476313 [Aspergillus sclerotioniger CBS 115572]PWY71769.1 hypothetical protein BO94DRAFT_476313 [Aspergillus sclerotioniger CBS 115572]